MPAPRKPVEESELVAQLQAELAQARAALAEREPGEDRLAGVLGRLAEVLDRPAPVKDAAVGAQTAHLLETTRDLEPIPDAETELPYEKVYLSRGKGFRVVFKPRRSQTDVDGNHFLVAGMECNFAPFGEYRTRNPDVAAFLERRDSFGREFWDSENIPGSVPDIGIAMEKLTGLVADLNIEEIDRMEQEERAGLNRSDLMRAIKGAQRQVTQVREKISAQAQQPVA